MSVLKSGATSERQRREEQRRAEQRRDQKSRAQLRVAQRDESRTEAQRLKPAEFRAMNVKSASHNLLARRAPL